MPMYKPGEYEQFIEWTAMPAQIREPKLQSELAAKLKVDPATLSDWKRRDGFWDDVTKQIRLWAKDRTPAVVDALAKRAIKTGDPAAAKLWLQVFDSFVEESRVQLSPQEKILAAYGLTKDGKISDDLVKDAEMIVAKMEGEDGKDDEAATAAPQDQA